MHDPSAMIACVKPELFGMEALALGVVKDGPQIGDLQRRDDTDGRKIDICLDVNSAALLSEFKATLSALS